MGEAQGLPLTVEDVTAGWLSDALGSVVDRADVTGVAWGTATKVLLDVTYAGGGDRYPGRLCVKGGFVPELRAIMAPGYQAEARFYRDVAPGLGDGLATCFFAAVDESTGQGVVILEDLAGGRRTGAGRARRSGGRAQCLRGVVGVGGRAAAVIHPR